MLRLLKFQARFHFEVDGPTRVALLECRHEIVKSAQARLLEELLRMLESGASERFFRLMTEHGLIHHLMPAFGEFMESPEGEEVYAFLQEADSSVIDPENALLCREVLLACLVFPLLQRRISTRYSDREQVPHQGEIYQEVQDQISEIFQPFFLLSRKLRGVWPRVALPIPTHPP